MPESRELKEATVGDLMEQGKRSSDPPESPLPLGYSCQKEYLKIVTHTELCSDLEGLRSLRVTGD